MAEHVERFELESGKADAEPEYDAAGNLTYDGVHEFTYDAWNRLVEVAKAYKDGGGVLTGSTLATYEYDGLGRRIVRDIDNSAQLDATYDDYYDGQRVIEVRCGSDDVLKQQVWGLEYIDELVQIGTNDDPTDGTEDDVETFYYTLCDANYNVQLLIDDEGVIVERYEYAPYGERTVYISPGTNDPDAHAPTLLPTRVAGQPYAICEFGHQGLMHDDVSGLIYNRARLLHPRFGQFMSRDPLGYPDGLNGYAAHHVMRGGLDPSGQLVIFVHGILNLNKDDIDEVYSELQQVWGNTNNQALIRFVYTQDGGNPPNVADAIAGTNSFLNLKAGESLAGMIKHLQRQKPVLRRRHNLPADCDEPIHLIGYSNGSNVVYHALATYGATADSVTFIGGSVDDGRGIWGLDYKPFVRNAGQFTNFWSDSDGVTDLPVPDGVGSDGLPDSVKNMPGVRDVEVMHVKHSVSEAHGAGFPDMDASNTERVSGPTGPRGGAGPEATTWLTRFMARTHYADTLAPQGDLLLSRFGHMQRGTQLQPNTLFYRHVDVHRTTRKNGFRMQPTTTEGVHPEGPG